MHYDSNFVTQKADVFGDFDHETFKKINDGMVVAKTDDVCPIFGDVVPYKSVTVICMKSQESEVRYWLSYVHGGPASKRFELPDDRVAIRSDYQAW